MGVLEVLTGITTAAGTLTDVTMQGNDSLTVRDPQGGPNPLLLQAWAKSQAAGEVKIRSPRMHDNTEGLLFATTVDDAQPLLPWGFTQELHGSDTLQAQIAGSATAGDIDILSLLVYYPQLPGSDARLQSPGEIRGSVAHLHAITNTIATGTDGSYTGAEAINAEHDQFKAGSEYALLGYTVSAECGTVAWTSADLSNFRIGAPGDELNRWLTADWFVRLSEEYSLPLIPVLSESNLDGTNIEVVQDEDGADVTVTSILAELR